MLHIKMSKIVKDNYKYMKFHPSILNKEKYKHTSYLKKRPIFLKLNSLLFPLINLQILDGKKTSNNI